MEKCRKCGVMKPNGVRCSNCRKIYNRRYYTFRSRELSEAGAAYNRKLRLEVIKAYGGCCACCGEKRLEFLAVDHINGGGTKHRKELNKGKNRGGRAFYHLLRRSGWPAGYRILCHNCNMAMGMYGYCPHQREASHGVCG